MISAQWYECQIGNGPLPHKTPQNDLTVRLCGLRKLQYLRQHSESLELPEREAFAQFL